jgi:SOS-response transcriptional repressor LexA
MQERPSKKQRELLQYIEGFIKGNGYGPSYREIMRALGYKSVSTVAVHVDGLINRGWLRKRDHSARSLEVVSLTPQLPRQPEDPHIVWLKAEISKREKAATPVDLEQVKILQHALLILEAPRKAPT